MGETHSSLLHMAGAASALRAGLRLPAASVSVTGER